MKVTSTNISQPRTIQWRGQSVTTGIFKEPVEGSVSLGDTDVEGDAVIDRRYHGGLDQACYLYSADHYPIWAELYTDKDLPSGMFGENLTVEGLDETQIIIGSTYQLGSAVVQVSAPREPCFKLGVRFGDQGVLKQMIQNGFCGVYLRVLETGDVKKGDVMEPLELVEDGVTIREAFRAIYDAEISDDLKSRLLADEYMPDKLKVKLVGRHGVPNQS